MKITCLVNNYSINKEFSNEEGLSLYIENKGLKLLFDTGLGKALFLNANTLSINLQEIDYIILSHSHKDHMGALKELLELNKKAKVICHRLIFSENYSKSSGDYRFIGTSAEGLDLSRFVFIEDYFSLEQNFEIFGDFRDYEDTREQLHFVKNGNYFYPDFARNEIYLFIDGIMITGCSHRGIINIINEMKKKRKIDYVIGGLHLRNKKLFEVMIINNTLNVLGIKKSYVNHCTFKTPLIERTLDNFEYFFAGDTLELGGK